MQAWENFLVKQEADVGAETVNRWLRTLKVVDFDAGNIRLEAKDSFQVLWFEEHVRPKLQMELLNTNGRPIQVHMRIRSRAEMYAKGRGRGLGKKKPEEPEEFKLSFDELDPLLTFSRFKAPKEEHLAWKVFCEITGYDPEKGKLTSPTMDLATFNPIYLSGPSGSGKTHLMMATADALRIHGKRVLYVRAETFTEHVVSAIRSGKMHEFRQAYRHADVLMIDNVHILSRKAATQEELFHTFNTLHVSGKQIILASICSPAELQSIEPRLVSRFEWGIALQMPAADKEYLGGILETKAQALNLNLEERSKIFLLETFNSNPKVLIRSLEALVLRTHLDRDKRRGARQISLEMAKDYLADLIDDEQRAVVTPGKIIERVAEHYGIRKDDIVGKSQSRECAMPRKVAMFLCREELRMPFMRIGETFSRDHSTVMSNVKQVKKEIEEQNRDLIGMVVQIRKQLHHRELKDTA